MKVWPAVQGESSKCGLAQLTQALYILLSLFSPHRTLPAVGHRAGTQVREALTGGLLVQGFRRRTTDNSILRQG